MRSGRNNAQGPVSRKSRNFTGHFRVSQFPLYLKNGEDLSRQASQLFFFLLSLKHVKKPAFQNKRLAVSQMAFRKTFEKLALGLPHQASVVEIAVDRVNHHPMDISVGFDKL